MGKQQFRLLVCSATAIALLAGSLLAIPWFRIEVLGSAIEIDLQSASACSAQKVCMSVPLSKLNGLYPATATVSFYAGLLLLLVVIVQSASKIVTGAVHDRITRIGYVLAVATLVCGFSAGFLFGPDGTAFAKAVGSITVERTLAPLAFLVGNLAAFAVLYYASTDLTDEVAEYKPVQFDKRLPVTPITNKMVTRGSGSIPLEGTARSARPPTQPPLDRRPITPSGGLRTDDLRSKSPSSPPGRALTPSGGFRTPTTTPTTPPTTTTTPSTGSRVDDLRSPPLSAPTRSLTPGGGFARTDATGRSMTPSGGFARTDATGRSMTPSGGFARTDATGRSMTPNGGFARTDATGRSMTPNGGFARTDATGRSMTPSGGFARIDSTPTSGSARTDDTRTRPPTQPPQDRARPPTQPPHDRTRPPTQPPHDRARPPTQPPQDRARPPTQPPYARIEDTRTKAPSQQPFVARTSSQSGIADPRAKTSSQQPFVARTTSPSGIADPSRTKTSSQQPFVARTTSPSGIADPSRTKTSSQQPFVARTTSPSGIADPSRTKTSSQQPFVARTASPSGIADPSRTKTSSQQPFVARTTSPSGIADPSRSKSPSQPPIDPVARARTSSSGPIDLAARLSAAVPNPLEGAPNLAVSIRPPLPTPEPVPPDQIPVDPAAGLTIRKRTASAAPHSEMMLTPVTGTPVTGTSVTGTSVTGTSVTGTSVTGTSVTGTSVTGTSVTGTSVTGTSVTGTPVTGTPVTGTPVPPALPDHAFAPPVAIPTPPESGLLIRQRRPSAAVPTEKPAGHDGMPGITLDGLENLAEALALAAAAELAAPEPEATDATAPPPTSATTPAPTSATAPPPMSAPRPAPTDAIAPARGSAAKLHELPEYVRGKINFAVLTAELASGGIKARREDGLEKLVTWDEIVGIVARRLPADKPFEGATVVDLLSTAGATLRIVPWTKLDGHPFDAKAVERARSFVNVVAAMALDAKLDTATKTFANGDGDAAQLPSVAALATHDSKVG